MKQTIVVAKPPVYDACVHVFGKDVIVGKPILWSYGDKIYNPLDVDIPRELIAHEGVHGVRQLAQGVEAWWKLYLENKLFRYMEEVWAHRAEWRSVRKWHPGRGDGLDHIAGKLAGPLYGHMVSLEQARQELVGA